MDIKIYNKLTALDDLYFEVTEKKGRCHPDTLSDRLAELLSVTYSKMTQEKFGVILRHQFDKLSLMGGKCDVRYGGGEFREPIRLLINGRVTQRFGNESIEVRELLQRTAKDFLEKELVNFNFDKDCRVMWEYSSNPTRGMIDEKHQGTSPIHHRFAPRSLADLPESKNPISNDTAVGCYLAPLSKLESLVIEIEKNITSDEARNLYPWLGTDCKIMAIRTNREVNLTVSVPQISTSVHSPEEYVSNLKNIENIITSCIERYDFEKVNFTLNPGDNTDKEMFYLRLTGSCIESGDEGQVSRGNRLGGIISSKRIFSIEGLSGKNPMYHAGKIYSVAAYDIANRIYQELDVSAEVFIVSQIDRPVNTPWSVIVNTDKEVDKVKVEKIVNEELKDSKIITQRILQGKYPLNY